MEPGETELTPVAGRSVVLSSSQFNRLCGVMLNGTADLDEVAKVAPTQLPPLLHLGRSVYFGWSRYRSTLVASIRVYRQNTKGDLFPTKAGFSFGQRCVDTLKEIMYEMTLMKEAARLQPDIQPLDGLAYPPVKNMVVNLIHDFIGKDRKAKCTACIQHEGLPRDHDGEEEEKKKDHSCNKLLAPNQLEWRTALALIKAKKCIEAYLLSHELVTAPVVIDLDTSEFFDKSGKEIFDSVSRMFTDQKF